MSSTSKDLHTQKYRNILKEVEHNQYALNTALHFTMGNIITVDGVYQIPPYSTVVLSTRDQLLLAVDKIDYPELKTSFTPTSGGNSDGVGYTYDAVFSMNSGDMEAMKKILRVVKPEMFIIFNVNDYPEEIHCQLDRCDTHEISCSFTSNVTGCKKVDTISSRIVARATSEGKLNWKYVIRCHCLENHPPSDNSMRQPYTLFQSAIRSVMSAFGIVPHSLLGVNRQCATSTPIIAIG